MLLLEHRALIKMISKLLKCCPRLLGRSQQLVNHTQEDSHLPFYSRNKIFGETVNYRVNIAIQDICCGTLEVRLTVSKTGKAVFFGPQWDN